MNIHFCGIGGSGMSPLAQYLIREGHTVTGSDRSYDSPTPPADFETLKKQGIRLFPQDGSGISKETEAVVASTAVEETVPDISRAREMEIPLKHRSDILAEIFHAHPVRIAVAGTSGKSTTTAMIGHILQEAGLSPTVLNGAVMKNVPESEGLGNMRMGAGNICVAETDESDGTLHLYAPTHAVITNISEDHKPLPELLPLFGAFAEKTRQHLVINADCPHSRYLPPASDPRVRTFAFDHHGNLQGKTPVSLNRGSRFHLNNHPFTLSMPGEHNARNAAAATTLCMSLDLSLETCARALETFRGISRRLEFIGEAGGITVIDDFAHNPEKITATLSTLKSRPGRLLCLYQPHGFAPTRFLRKGLVRAFKETLSAEDIVFLPEIHYAGGTVSRDISSADLAEDLKKAGYNAFFEKNRDTLLNSIPETARPGDCIVIMGARDPGLAPFARALLAQLSEAA